MITVDPQLLDLGDVQVDHATASGAIAIVNDGPGDLVLADIRIVDSGTGATFDWSYIASGACPSPIGMTAPCTLAEHQQLELAITFAPSTIAARDATLVIDYHDTADHSLSIPLDGRGLGATLARVGAMRLDLGRVPVGTMATARVQLANDGNVALAGIALAAIGAPLTVSPTMLDLPFGTPTAIEIACTPATATTTMGKITATPPVATEVLPVEIEVTCTGTTQPLFSIPSTIWLGEVRRAAAASVTIELRATTGSVALTAAELAAMSPALGVTLDGAATPTTSTLAIAPTADGPLDDAIAIHALAGDVLAIPIAGTAVTASASAPTQLALGTFCVNQPTAPVLVSLDSLGSATIALPDAPVFARPSSPFAIRLVAPSAYPARLLPHGRAVLEVSPAPATAAGVVTDRLAWTTDVAGAEAIVTQVTAQFIADDGAISPTKIAFGQVPISHLDHRNGHLVTIQNCGADAIDVTAKVPSPFEIEEPGLPASLAPGQIARVSVGFQPQLARAYTGDLVVTSPQLAAPLVVALAGEGIATGGDGDFPTTPSDESSFYACSCGAGSHTSPTGAIVIGLAVASAIARRRKR